LRRRRGADAGGGAPTKWVEHVKESDEEPTKMGRRRRLGIGPAAFIPVLKSTMLPAADGRKEAQYVAVPEHAARIRVSTIENDDLRGMLGQL